MAPFIAPLRRHRFVLLLVAIPLLIVFLSPSRSSSSKLDNVRSGGLGTNTWGDQEWSNSEHHVQDELAPGPNRVKDWLSWNSNKGERTILVTGGAGSLGHALITRLVGLRYTVHAADIVSRPATLPEAVIYHRIDVTGSAIQALLGRTQFDGIVHFAAISLEQWCAPKHDECERINVGGTKSLLSAIQETVNPKTGGLLGWSGNRKMPWLIYGSSMDVYGSAEKSGSTVDESTATAPTSWIGKTKLGGEDAIREVFQALRRTVTANEVDQAAAHKDESITNDGAGPGEGVLRTAILRFSDIYGYPRVTNVPAAFIPRLLQNAVSSLPIQFNSDLPTLDLLHVDDAVAAVTETISFLDRTPKDTSTPTLDVFNIVKGGKRWGAKEVVDLVRSELDSLSPIRDIGSNKAAKNSPEYSAQRANEVLQWTPKMEAPVGLAYATAELAREVADYTDNFVNNHCPQYASGHGNLPEQPEDARNRDLYKIDNCTVNLGFNHDGWLHHLKCMDGKHCLADDIRVSSYNWNATVWIIRGMDKSKKSNGRATVRFEQENGMGYLGLRESDIADGGEVKWELFHDNDPVPHVDTFEVEVAPDRSFLRIMLPGRKNPKQQIAAQSVGKQTQFKLEPAEDAGESHYDMRMTMLCCSREGDWPLLLDDHESADTRFGTEGQIAFNASRRLHLCERAHEAHGFFTTMAEKLKQTAELGGHTTAAAKVKKMTSKPDNWALKELPPCWNDCNSPTICVQTGGCKCVQADNCARRRENPLIALGRGIHPAGGRTSSPLGSLGGYDEILAKLVEKTDWRDLLLPEARDYLHAHPEFIKVHVVDGYPKQKEIEAAECHKLQPTHCFSADSIMYKAMRHLSVPADEAELIILPVYQHCTGADFILHEVWHYASKTIKGIDEQTKPVSMMMTHDWGICLAFTWEVWESREKNDEGVPRLYPDPIMKNSLVWSVMGDWDTRCYRPVQDVVVPARTCNSIKLVDRFPDVTAIQPVRDRPQLINWSGTYWGTGKSERLRLTCHRGGVADEELIEGEGPQSKFPKAWDDYLTNLNNARFCPQPRGVAGWSPRVNDAIYAGCIPVLLAEGSHYPFASMLDWSQFSVRIHPTELDHIERILNDIPLERVEQMQANLVTIREAFLYATDEHPEAELERRGPMFFALHAAGMRLRTEYPDRHA